MVGKYETRKGYEVAIEAFGLAYEKNKQIYSFTICTVNSLNPF